MKDVLQLLRDIRKDYGHPWPNEDELTKIHRMSILKKIINVKIDEIRLRKFIPLDKSYCIRMCFLDLFRSEKDSIFNSDKFDHTPIFSDDLIALSHAVRNWISNNNTIYVGESGTLFRFFQFAIWKYNHDKTLECRGTLLDRQITRNKNIVNFSQEELLKLDNGTSQWASAAVLLGDDRRINNPPNKLLLTYQCVDEWLENKSWKPIMDETIHKQALYFYKLMCGETAEFIPIHSEDFCFAYVFGKITKEEGLKRWPSLVSHESNRIEEMELNMDKAKRGELILSKDHRVVQAIAMWSVINYIDVQFKYPDAVFKSWPVFWSFLENF